MPTSILHVPPEVLQKIALYAILGSRSEVGPPQELYSCLLTCRTFNLALSPANASELYYRIFAQKFDVRGPIYRLGAPVVREHAPYEMRRRFLALQIFKNRSLYHPDLTEALWIAYLMVEDADTSQKNVRQLLRANLPSFLGQYLRDRLYEGAEKNGVWPVMTDQNSLVIALSWTLASKQVIIYEKREVCEETVRLLRPIVFAAFRYSIFHTPENSFTYSGAAPLLSSHFTTISSSPPSSPISPFSSSSSYSSSDDLHDEQYSASVIPPQDISYFGTVKRKARPPSAAIFATLLYFVRTEVLTACQIPPHLTCQTREEANQIGQEGPCVDDIRQFNEQCRTRFADFPGIDVGIRSSATAAAPDTILCQPSLYQLGRLCGQWRGSYMYPLNALFAGMPPAESSRKALYISLKEHFCYEETSAVPLDDPENETENAWLPADIQVVETQDGVQFFDGKGSFKTTYETYRYGVTKLRNSRQIADVIITGKIEDRHVAAWGGPSKILGRVRLHDGLMVLVRYSSLFIRTARGYLTEASAAGICNFIPNLVGRLAHPKDERDLGSGLYYEGVFSLGKDHTHVTSQSNYKVS